MNFPNIPKNIIKTSNGEIIGRIDNWEVSDDGNINISAWYYLPKPLNFIEVSFDMGCNIDDKLAKYRYISRD